MSTEIRSPRARRGLQASTAYLYSWVAVAVCGMAYVGIAATRPDIIGAVLPLADQSNEQAYGHRAAADVVDELATLRKWVHDMQHDLAATRSALQDQASQNAQLAQRISAAEERIPVVRDARAEAAARLAVQRAKAANGAQPVAAPAPSVGQSAAAAPAVAPVPPVQVAAAAPAQAAADVSNVRVINGNANGSASAAPITTGSVASAPASAPPVPVAAAPKSPVSPRGIEIGSAESLESLRSRWGEIAGRNADVVGELAPRYRLATDGRPAPFTLVAGPFGTTADAAKTCAQLKAKGVACRVSDFSGSGF